MWTLRNPQTGQAHPIPESGLRIGRAAGNDLVLADNEVSRYHATVWLHGGQAYIRDENSTNGTWVNEQRVTAPTPLRPGDRIRLGKTVLEVVGREPGATVVSMPGTVVIPPVAPSYPPAAPPSYPAMPPVSPAAAPPRRSRLPLILGLGGGGLLLLCGAVILALVVLKVPLPGIAPRPSPTPTPTPTPVATPTPSPTPTPSDAWVIVMTENFEGDFPGEWELVTDNRYTWGKRDCRAYEGRHSAWAVGGGGRGETLRCGSNYPNGISVGMHYGPFSLDGATAAEMRFWYWMNTENLFDRFCWGASANGEDFFGNCISGSDRWSEEVLDFSDVPTLGDLLDRSRVWIAFYFHSDDSETYPEGAYVDNIVVRKCLHPSGRCR